MKKRKKLKNLNVAAIVAFVLVLISGIVFPLFNFYFLGVVQVASERTTMFNLIIEMILGNISFNFYYSFIIFLLILVYLAILFMYFLNGIKVVPHIYSTHASYLCFVFMILGFLGVFLFNRFESIIIFGFRISSVGSGPLLFVMPIIGVLYLLLKDVINRSVKF